MLTTNSTELIRLRYKARELKKTKKPVLNAFSGNLRTRKRGHGIEFHEARPYTYGDDVRNIDWRITARKTTVHTREFQQDHEQNQFLLIDQSLPMRFATTHKLKSVQAAHLAALIGWSSIESKNRIGAMIEGPQSHFLKQTLNAKKFCYWLGKLALSTEQLVNNTRPQPADWQASINRCLQLMSTGTHLIIIGDLIYLQENHIDLLMHASRHHQISGIHIYDKFEENLPPLNHTSFTDGENIFKFNGINKAQRRQYTKKIDKLTNRFKKFGGQILTCATDNEPQEMITTLTT
jgi:uncharacterized protein (DUF58 family)